MRRKILVLGVTGMLGNALFRYLSDDPDFEVFGTLRNEQEKSFFSEQSQLHLFSNIDILDQDALIGLFEKIKPNIVINCIGLIKQMAAAINPLAILPLNAMFPHRLANLCGLSNARLIHLSTDCVFSGEKGMYTESDKADADDLYGMSKFLGEIKDRSHVTTLRTSFIGHELQGNYELIDWFLSQKGRVKGFSKAIYSGIPTVELAKIIAKLVIPNENLFGLYHISSDPVDKFSLLKLVAEIYGKDIEIVEDNSVRIDRSLDSTAFKKQTGYVAPSWVDLIQKMKNFN